MRNLLAIAALTCLLFILVTGNPQITLAQTPNQTTCPVMKGQLNKNIYADYQGKRIYFCCPPCLREFNNNPEKYMKELEKQGVVLENTPQEKN